MPHYLPVAIDTGTDPRVTNALPQNHLENTRMGQWKKEPTCWYCGDLQCLENNDNLNLMQSITRLYNKVKGDGKEEKTYNERKVNFRSY